MGTSREDAMNCKTCSLAIACCIALVGSAGNSVGTELSLVLGNTASGGDAYVRIADDDTLEPQVFTVETWVHPLGPSWGTTRNGVIFAKAQEEGSGKFLASIWMQWTHNTNKIRVLVTHDLGDDATAVISNATVPVGTWAHVAMTFDGSWLRLFINGQLDNEAAAVASNVDYGPEDILLGAANFVDDWVYRFKGIIDEVRFWDHVRLEAEIAAQMNRSLIGSETGLLAYYTFNQGDANDDSGNGHDGVFEGTPTSVYSTLPYIVFVDDFEVGSTSRWSSTYP
jgi:hypothetical protein